MIRMLHSTSAHRQHGAVIMIMLLILIMGSAYFLLTKLNKGDAQQPRNIDATADLGAITDALIGYALTHNHCLPCPDTDNDGQAETSCGMPAVGTLPWITVNLGAIDVWGHRLRYAVDPDFTDAGTGICNNNATQSGQLQVQTTDTAGNPVDLTLDAPAVVLAFGANGYCAVSTNGMTLPNPPVTHLHEIANCTATANFIQRPASSDPAAVGGPFDDLLAWVALAELHTQLGKAPLP